MSIISIYNCLRNENPVNISAYHLNVYDYMYSSLNQIYLNFGIEGLTRPPLHPNLFNFHTKSVDETPLNPLIVEILKTSLTEGWFDNYNLNQMRDFFDECDARIFALGSKVTCDNCGVGLGIWWEIKPAETCLWAVCYNCHNNLSNVDVVDNRCSSDYQADYCSECGAECGSDMCRYCEYDDVGRCGECGEDCGAYICRYCRRDYD